MTRRQAVLASLLLPVAQIRDIPTEQSGTATCSNCLVFNPDTARRTLLRIELKKELTFALEVIGPNGEHVTFTSEELFAALTEK